MVCYISFEAYSLIFEPLLFNKQVCLRWVYLSTGKQQQTDINIFPGIFHIYNVDNIDVTR